MTTVEMDCPVCPDGQKVWEPNVMPYAEALAVMGGDAAAAWTLAKWYPAEDGMALDEAASCPCALDAPTLAAMEERATELSLERLADGD